MATRQYEWHKVAGDPGALELGSNGLAEVVVNGKTICLALHNNVLYGCAAKCPHAGGVMAAGFTDALGNVVCPLHRYKFSLQNGRNTSGEGYYLKTYPVRVEESGVYIGIEVQRGLFG